MGSTIRLVKCAAGRWSRGACAPAASQEFAPISGRTLSPQVRRGWHGSVVFCGCRNGTQLWNMECALLWVLGLAAAASCVITAVLASFNEELYQPTLRVLLRWWVTLPFIFAGIVAWRWRPDSFFGQLMILSGFITQLSILQWTSPAGVEHRGAAVRPTRRGGLVAPFPRLPLWSTRRASRASRSDHRICRRSGPPGCDLDAGRIE